MNESCYIWMSHVTYEWVMSHMNESCHIWMSHVNESSLECHTYEWVISHIWTSHVTHVNESCHIWTSHVTHVNESCHIWTSHVSNVVHMNESCQTCERVVSHASCHTRKRVMSRIWTSHITHMNEPKQRYGVATVSSIDEIIGLFCRVSSLL